MTDRYTPTDKTRALFGGSDNPAENPVRFRKCTVCAGDIDIMNDTGIEWTPGEDAFAHRACLKDETMTDCERCGDPPEAVKCFDRACPSSAKASHAELAAYDRRRAGECEACEGLHKLTREGKARTYNVSLSGAFQAIPGTEDDVLARMMDQHASFIAGRVWEAPEDEQQTFVAVELEYKRWERVFFVVFRRWPQSVTTRRTEYVRAWMAEDSA